VQVGRSLHGHVLRAPGEDGVILAVASSCTLDSSRVQHPSLTAGRWRDPMPLLPSFRCCSTPRARNTAGQHQRRTLRAAAVPGREVGAGVPNLRRQAPALVGDCTSPPRRGCARHEVASGAAPGSRRSGLSRQCPAAGPAATRPYSLSSFVWTWPRRFELVRGLGPGIDEYDLRVAQLARGSLRLGLIATAIRSWYAGVSGAQVSRGDDRRCRYRR
jgi:hypothetical protein